MFNDIFAKGLKISAKTYQKMEFIEIYYYEVFNTHILLPSLPDWYNMFIGFKILKNFLSTISRYENN